jgi:hypothetical protein
MKKPRRRRRVSNRPDRAHREEAEVDVGRGEKSRAALGIGTGPASMFAALGGTTSLVTATAAGW